MSRRAHVTERVAVGALFLLWLLVNLDLLALGPFVAPSGDQTRYTGAAEALIEGEAINPQNTVSMGYILLLALIKQLGLGLEAVVVVQMLVGGLAALAAYSIARQVAGPLCGALAAVLILVIPDFTRIVGWQHYILPDALYAYGLVIAVWGTERAAAKQRIATYAAAFLLVAAAASIRPEGWSVIPVVIAYWILRADMSRRARRMALTALAACLILGTVAVVNNVNTAVEANSPAMHVAGGWVFWIQDDWRQSMPDDEVAGNSTGALLSYTAKHPVAVAKLMLIRIGVEFLHVRPYFSAKHNLIYLMYLIPVYVLALLALILAHRAPLVRLLVAIVVSQLPWIAVISADDDARWLVHFLPLIAIAAALGAGALATRLANRRQATRPLSVVSSPT